MELPRDQTVGKPLADVMVAIKLQDSKAAARRLIKVASCTVCSCCMCRTYHALTTLKTQPSL